MTLTKAQNKELDSLKNHIETIEKKIEKAKDNMATSIEFDDKSAASKFEKAINFGYNKIEKMVGIQSQSMKLEYDLVLDLIFDREHTLELINK